MHLQLSHAPPPPRAHTAAAAAAAAAADGPAGSKFRAAASKVLVSQEVLHHVRAAQCELRAAQSAREAQQASDR
jgi:hypothetical protein